MVNICTKPISTHTYRFLHILTQENIYIPTINVLLNLRTKSQELILEQLLAENREKEEKLETYQQLLLADGVDPEELIATMSTSKTNKSTRAIRLAKYHYTNENGQENTWTAQGRTLKFLADNNLDDYRI
ncbi:transcriptional regulator [Photobacterium damselae]|uniref:H-NS family histone-like protein n=1 Tax=Photobacterium damselae TaxID=38293 RepID=UPI0035D06264